MPAVMTHDFFGRDIYNERFVQIGQSKDEFQAFLLGNQGPDPLFFCVISPTQRRYKALGHLMHDEQPSELLVALKESIMMIDEPHRSIARAYALGFLCHYALDSNMHPLVYAQQYAYIAANVDGLSADDGSEVHGVIESEFDEMMLFTKTGHTVATYNPSRETLQASDDVLEVISKMYVYIAMKVYGMFVPPTLFNTSTRDYRFILWVLYSPTGTKRDILSSIESSFRSHSMMRAMSPRPVQLTDSIYSNSAHGQWTNPFTDEVHTESFGDLYDKAQQCARAAIDAFDSPSFDTDAARAITHTLNFSGKPTEPIITVED